MNSPNTTDVPNAVPDPEPFAIDTRAVADALRTFCEAKYRNDPDWRQRFDAWLAGIRAANREASLSQIPAQEGTLQ